MISVTMLVLDVMQMSLIYELK